MNNPFKEFIKRLDDTALQYLIDNAEHLVKRKANKAKRMISRLKRLS